MAVERADGLAVRTGGDLELLDDGEPILVAAVEPSFAHGGGLPGTREAPSVPLMKTWCEEAGSDKDD